MPDQPPNPSSSPAPNALAALTAAVVLVLLLAAGPAMAGGRPERLVERLRVNTSQDYRQVAIKDEAAGVADLRAATAGEPFEEFWAFIPKTRRWVELGCCERRTAQGNYVGIEYLLVDIMAANRRLVLYHTHPRTSFIRENYHPDRAAIKIMEEALPSPQDMETMVGLARRFRALQPGGDLSWRIVSRHGVTTYGLAAPGAEPSESDYRLFAFSPWDEDQFQEQPPEPGPQMDRYIAEAVRGLSRGPFVVSFEPLLPLAATAAEAGR